MAHQALVDSYLATLSFDRERSRLQIGGVEVSFHCDKFNTRVLKNFEDVMGYEQGGQLLFESAAATSHAALSRFLLAGPGAAAFTPLDFHARLEAAAELFKVLAYGAIEIVSATPLKAVFRSRTSYLAEGWLENKDRWNLDEREGPACHDIRGHLAAALAVAAGRPWSGYRVVETQCRAYKNAPVCEFVAEVK